MNIPRMRFLFEGEEGRWEYENESGLHRFDFGIDLGTTKMSFSFTENKISVHMLKAAEWFLDEYSGFAGGALA